MDYQILIIESDENSAKILKDQFELITQMKCTIAFELLDIHRHLQTIPEIEYIFLFYDVSDDAEQVREQTTRTYVLANYPWIQVYSIGSFKQEAITIINQKVFFFNTNDIVSLTENNIPLNQKSRSKRMKNFNAFN